jgi:hypothetical protein
MNNTFYNTHDQFFKVINKHMLNELYRRSNKQIHILEDDINNRLQNYNVNVTKSDECHIYINFIKGDKQIGHISLHIGPKNNNLSKKAKQIGRFHAINDIRVNTSYTFKLNRNSNIFISYNKNKFISKELKYILDIVLGVLNEYFNPISKLSLNNYDANYTDNCIKIIKDKMYIRNSFNNTRKQRNKL